MAEGRDGDVPMKWIARIILSHLNRKELGRQSQQALTRISHAIRTCRFETAWMRFTSGITVTLVTLCARLFIMSFQRTRDDRRTTRRNDAIFPSRCDP
jgi:hypothetical protein